MSNVASLIILTIQTAIITRKTPVQFKHLLSPLEQPKISRKTMIVIINLDLIVLINQSPDNSKELECDFIL